MSALVAFFSTPLGMALLAAGGYFIRHRFGNILGLPAPKSGEPADPVSDVIADVIKDIADIKKILADKGSIPAMAKDAASDLDDVKKTIADVKAILDHLKAVDPTPPVAPVAK